MKRMNLRLDFETCNDKKGDRYVKRNLKKICQELLISLGSETVKSIILTGATTRVEGSAISHGEKVEVFSDYDILVLVNKITQKIRKQLRHVSTILTKEFSRDGLPSHVDIFPISPQALSNMKACMFTLELKEYGRSLYGEDHKEYMRRYMREYRKRKKEKEKVQNQVNGNVNKASGEKNIESPEI